MDNMIDLAHARWAAYEKRVNKLQVLAGIRPDVDGNLQVEDTQKADMFIKFNSSDLTAISTHDELVDTFNEIYEKLDELDNNLGEMLVVNEFMTPPYSPDKNSSFESIYSSLLLMGDTIDNAKQFEEYVEKYVERSSI